MTWQWRHAAANLVAAEAANRKAQKRFGLAMEAVRAFTTGASEDVILKEKALRRSAEEAVGPVANVLRAAPGLAGGGNRPGVAGGAGRGLVRRGGALRRGRGAGEGPGGAPRGAGACARGWCGEQPGDTAARRDLGRSHLALARVLVPRYQLDEASAELGLARGVLHPLAREHPEDGGARLLEAECDGLEGERLYRNDRQEEALALLERSRTLYQRLIEDNPAYTLPTAADGPTEYRRGLATVLHVLGWIFFDEGRADACQRDEDEQQEVYEALASGPFATDADRRNLAHHYVNVCGSQGLTGRRVKGTRLFKRGVTICRRLVEENPLSVTDRIMLAFLLAATDAADPVARDSFTEALSIVRALSPEQRQTHDAVSAEFDSERGLAACDWASGRPDEALKHSRQAVAIVERWVRSGPDVARSFRRIVGIAWRNLAFNELVLGHDKEALDAAQQVWATLEPSLRANPRLRVSVDTMSTGLLIEAMVALRRGQPSEASRLADRAAALLEKLGPLTSFIDEPFYLGVAHAFFYAVGRPAGPGRPADPPRLPVHSDRAIALVREADRMGYRNPGATAMVNLLLGGPPEMKPLIMDQVFPIDPFRPDSGSKDDEPASDPQGTKP